MGRTQDSTKTKTTKWHKNNDLFLVLLESDIVEYYNVDDRGYIQTNKRAYVGLQATVILGKRGIINEDHYQMKDVREILIPRSDDTFSCEIGSRGALSSIGKEYAGGDVTVVVHNQ